MKRAQQLLLSHSPTEVLPTHLHNSKKTGGTDRSGNGRRTPGCRRPLVFSPSVFLWLPRRRRTRNCAFPCPNGYARESGINRHRRRPPARMGALPYGGTEIKSFQSNRLTPPHCFTKFSRWETYCPGWLMTEARRRDLAKCDGWWVRASMMFQPCFLAVEKKERIMRSPLHLPTSENRLDIFDGASSCARRVRLGCW